MTTTEGVMWTVEAVEKKIRGARYTITIVQDYPGATRRVTDIKRHQGELTHREKNALAFLGMRSRPLLRADYSGSEPTRGRDLGIVIQPESGAGASQEVSNFRIVDKTREPLKV